MFTNRLFYLSIVMAVLVVTACAPQVTVTPAPQDQSERVTLRLAVADAEGRPSEPYVLEFIEQVKTLSDGNITIEPIWDAGADTEPVFEQGVVKVVTEGQYDLGLAGSRAWDSLGVTSFQALQAPFLITNDALSEAVAASDIGTRMLDSLSSAGAVGLALWPEDLRHPFSVVPDKPIFSPEDFEGATVQVVPSGVSHMLIETLGGSPTFGDEEYQAAESGLRQGFSLTGLPIATGNIVFFPKFQVLFANGTTFEKLSEVQKNILREAAIATQTKAIAEHPSELDAATAWCADGGTVVMATEQQVAAFEAAAQPVFAQIEQDPLNAELIAAIRELKAKTAPSTGASACTPEVRQPNPEPSAESDEVWSQGLPPNGTWQAERTIDDFASTGMLLSVAESEYAGVYTITFKDGKYTLIFEGLRGQRGRCEADYELVEEDVMRLTYDQNVCDLPPEDIQWRIDEERLHLHHVASNGGPPEVEWSPVYEAKPWQKIEGTEEQAISPHPFAGETDWIAYQTNRTGEGVWLIHPDGTEDHQIAKDFPGNLQLPDWSPDGKKIIMTPRNTGGTEPLYEYDLATETYRQLFDCEDPCIGDDEPAYSPDGTKVAFIRALGPFTSTGPSDCGLWIGDIATGEVTQITSNPGCMREASPRWSPDGSKIAYFRERYDTSGVTTAIFVMNANGGEEQQLTDWELVAGYPDWSPDGEWIVFATHPLFTFNFDAVVSNLYRMRPDGSGIEQLTFYDTPDLRANQPRYTPNGKWILFTAVQPSSNTGDRRTDRSLWVIPAEGAEPIEITSGGIYTHGTWQPNH